MGIKGSCRSPNGGGCPFCMLSTYSQTPFLSCFHPSYLPAPSWQIFRQSGQIFSKKRQKLYFLWCVLVFSRDFGRPKGAKSKHIFESGCKVGAGCGSACLTFGVSTGGRCASFGACPLLSWRVPCLFVRSLALCLSGCLRICPYLRF